MTPVGRLFSFCFVARFQIDGLLIDLYEGGNQAGLLKRLEAMRESGVKCMCMLALSDSGEPSYDTDLAKKVAALAIPCFACTPGYLPELIEGIIKGRDLQKIANGAGSQ